MILTQRRHKHKFCIVWLPEHSGILSHIDLLPLKRGGHWDLGEPSVRWACSQAPAGHQRCLHLCIYVLTGVSGRVGVTYCLIVKCLGNTLNVLFNECSICYWLFTANRVHFSVIATWSAVVLYQSPLYLQRSLSMILPLSTWLTHMTVSLASRCLGTSLTATHCRETNLTTPNLVFSRTYANH